MQTTTLPIQVSGASATNTAQRPNGNGDASQFSAALSREIEQRQLPPATPAPQPSKPQAAQKPQAADKPAQADAKAEAQADTKAPVQESGKPAEAQASAQSGDDTAEPGAAKDAGATAQPANPVAEMLALVASFNQLVQKNGAIGTGGAGNLAAEASLPGVGGKTRGDAGQLAALQATGKRLGTDGSDKAQNASLTVADAGSQRAPLADASTSAERKGAAPDAVDVRATADTLGQAKTQVNGAELSAQQVRAAAAQIDALKNPAPAAQLVVQAQPALEGAAQAAVAAGEHLPARVGTQAWDNQVSQKVVWMVAGGDQSASLTLNPPDLGPMQVVLNVNGDQASVAFSSNQQEVRQALENALPRLREMMGESGIALGSATVSAGMPDQRQAQGGQAGSSSGGAARHDNGTASAEAAPRSAARTTAIGDRGMVDTFA